MKKIKFIFWFILLLLSSFLFLSLDASDSDLKNRKPGPHTQKEAESHSSKEEDFHRIDFDIIPTPKRMKREAGFFPLSENKCILIAGREMKDDSRLKIGIGKIQNAIEDNGGKPLQVLLPESLTPERLSNDKAMILVFLFEDPWFKKFCQTNHLDINRLWPEGLPGEQGYIINFVNLNQGNTKNKETSMDILLILSPDIQGLLYGCVTLHNMVSKNEQEISLAKVHIWDEPDFKYRMMDKVAFNYYFRRDQWKELIDFALEHKINLIWNGFLNYESPPISTDPEWFRKINDYAKQSGIQVIYGGWWNIGKLPRPKSASPFYYPEKGRGRIGHRGMLFCWSDDKLLNDKGKHLQEFIRKTHPGGIYFHPIDSGGLKDPEHWGKRCPVCRERFGNDRAMADAHVINTLYHAAKEEDPNILFITVIYPYRPMFFQDPEIKNWLIKLTKQIPEDVILCFREDKRTNYENLWKLVKQPIFIYHEDEPRGWERQHPYVTTFRYAKTFYQKERKRDIYWYNTCGPGGGKAKIKVLGGAEFAWNTEAPGSEYLNRISRDVKKSELVYSPAVRQDFLPRACRILFGKAGPMLEEVVSLNISAHFLESFPLSKLTKEECTSEIERAEKALRILEQAEILIKQDSRAHKNGYIYSAHMANTIASIYLARARIELLNMEEAPLLKLGRTNSHQKMQTILSEGERMFNQLKQKEFMPWHGGIDYHTLRKNFMDRVRKDQRI